MALIPPFSSFRSVVREKAPFSSEPVIVSLRVRKCRASIMNEAPAAFGICTNTQRCGWRGTSLFSIPFVVCRSRADSLRLSVAAAATSQRSSLMVGSLLRAALVDSGY